MANPRASKLRRGRKEAETRPDPREKIFAQFRTSAAKSLAPQQISREWFDTARRLIDTTVGRSETLAACRMPNDFFAMQLEMMRDTVEATLHGAKRVSEISARAATEATQKMPDAAKRAA
jgi:hypothetical protein